VRALIIGAGRGSRLGHNIPKTLVPVMGRPMLDWILEALKKAYLLDLLQEMLEGGVLTERENSAGGYMEIDTGQDLAMAETWWQERP
jgi:bifunctional N-acetylglucosamine-1-phosphate-uridyltransferase/glucosamine-1-phosphate-acetyltransferase GlmU-like protein